MNPSIASQTDLSILHLIAHASPVVQGVLILLTLMSISSWVIIIAKLRLYSHSKRDSQSFSETFWGGADMDSVLASIPAKYPDSALPNIFQAGYREFIRQRQHAQKEQQAQTIANVGVDGVRRSLDVAMSREIERLNRNLSLLATVGSTAPFVGLFGTVWGIMESFQNIGLTRNTSLITVAPGIAEALVATAFGLLAAIPAVVAYNKFTANSKQMTANMAQFATEFLNIIARHLAH